MQHRECVVFFCLSSVVGINFVAVNGVWDRDCLARGKLQWHRMELKLKPDIKGIFAGRCRISRAQRLELNERNGYTRTIRIQIYM